MKRGTALRITDSQGGANAGALFYNFECPVERYNRRMLRRTRRAPHCRAVLYSDMGRVLCSVTGDSGLARPIGGCSNAAMVRAKYGEGRYQECRNAWHKNALDSFLVELGKWGLGPRDLAPNVNFFSRVTVGDDGGMQFEPGNSPPGGTVELRAEMNVLVILNTCQHPLDPT